MTIDRRTFIVAGGVVAAAPWFPGILSSAMADSPSDVDPVAAPVSSTGIVLKIDGWHRDADTLPTSSDIEFWIRVGPSWRTAWR